MYRLALLLLLGLFLFSCADEKNQYPTYAENKTDITIESLIVNQKFPEGGELVFQARNNSQNTCNRLTINVNLFSKDKKTIAVLEISNPKIGCTKKYVGPITIKITAKQRLTNPLFVNHNPLIPDLETEICKTPKHIRKTIIK